MANSKTKTSNPAHPIIRLGVNLDHIATLRQLRGTPYPNLLEAAELAGKGGANQITVHLREDRRHIQDDDVELLKKRSKLPLNLEMAVTAEMIRKATKLKPQWCCLVPEKRQEVTTEGGLAMRKNFKRIEKAISQLQKARVRVSCFVEPSLESIRLSAEAGADAVEIHTGRYCLATQAIVPASKKVAQRKLIQVELERIQKAAILGRELGLRVHAGHGFDFENVRAVAALEDSAGVPWIEEYNIGHAIVCRASLVGMERAVREMVSAIMAP